MLSTLLIIALAALPVDPSTTSKGLSVEALASPIKGNVQLVQANRSIRLPLDSWTLLEKHAVLHFESDAEVMLLCPDGSCHLLKKSSMFYSDVCTSMPQEPCLTSPRRTSDPIHEETRLVNRPLNMDDADLERLRLWILPLLDSELRGRPRDPSKPWGEQPELVSPRCPNLGQGPQDCEAWRLNPRHIRFLEVENVKIYHFELSGPSRFEPQSVEPREMTCEPWPAFADHPVCTVPWPESWSLPTDGATVQLRIKAEVDGRLRVVQHPTRLRQLSEHQAQLISEALDVVHALPQPLTTPWRRLALARAGLVSELHADLLGQAERSSAETIALAKSYLALGSIRAAQHHFNQVPHGLNDGRSLRRAEVEIGLARCALELDAWETSRAHLETAEKIYRSLANESGLDAVNRLREDLKTLAPH